jgi:hypothetical protein
VCSSDLDPPALKELVPVPGPVVPKAPSYGNSEFHVFVYVDQGVSPGYAKTIERLTGNRPITVSKGESRVEFMSKSVHLAQKETLVWFEYPLVPFPEFFVWSSFAGPVFGAILCWKRVTPVQETLVRSACWYRGRELRKHKFDSASYLIYPRKGFFMFSVETLKGIIWPDLRSEDVELMLGAAAEQLGFPMVDAGHVVGEYS